MSGVSNVLCLNVSFLLYGQYTIIHQLATSIGFTIQHSVHHAKVEQHEHTVSLLYQFPATLLHFWRYLPE